jgi:hypothetical protein
VSSCWVFYGLVVLDELVCLIVHFNGLLKLSLFPFVLLKQLGAVEVVVLVALEFRKFFSWIKVFQDSHDSQINLRVG